MDKAAWQALLDKFDYKTALEIYLPYCQNNALKKILSNHNNAFAIKKLKEGIRTMAQTDWADLAEKVPQFKQQLLDNSFQLNSLAIRDYKAEFREAPAEVKVIISRQILLKNEARVLKQNLPQMDGLKAHQAVFDIRAKWAEVQILYEKEEYWKTHGELPQEFEINTAIVLPENDIDMLNRFKTLKTYKNRTTWPKYTDEYNALESKLKEHDVI